jgi:thiosulfate/3-mercaptopyruvate sulfurtransferase
MSIIQSYPVRRRRGSTICRRRSSHPIGSPSQAAVIWHSRRTVEAEDLMSKRLRHWWLLILCNLVPIVPAMAMAADTSTSRLASVQWLQENLKREDVALIDASPPQLYAASHIPGALNVDLFSFGGLDVTPAEMERRIQSWGIDGTTKVVLYDQGGTYLATSLFFDLYYHGIPAGNLVLLDGGFAKWQAQGGMVTKEPAAARKAGTFKVTNVRDEVRVRLPEFLVASGDPANNALLEALDPVQHFGAMKFFDRAGHIPNAVMSPGSDYFNADKTFRSPEEIRRMLAYLGVKPEQQVLAHCGGGIAASVPFFAAKFMLDYPRVKLYKESQLEWMRDDRMLPLWTYDAPQMTRDKAWLNGWGNVMMRRYGVSKLVVIDVRPEAAFKLAHLPFAINIPGDVFKRNVAAPAKLAEVLGAAGVNATDEAVIVSQGGLSPDAALAYLLLQKLGQKRVSVFTETVDDWAFAGFPLEKEANAADAKKAAPVMPRPYPANLRAGIVARTAENDGALYPTVYVASGKALPMKLPEGKVVHVPYTELLNENGTPKAAKDIWDILVKAGVPRYAEIVSVADDPGEAAATYFILKLMGYPDVKVLAS